MSKPSLVPWKMPERVRPGTIVSITLSKDPKLIGSELVDMPLTVFAVDPTGQLVSGNVQVGLVALADGVFVPQVHPVANVPYSAERKAGTWRLLQHIGIAVFPKG